MKNHLSTVPSMGAGGKSWPAGILATSAGSAVPLETLALFVVSHYKRKKQRVRKKTYVLISPLGEAPLMSFSQASAHS